MPQTHSLRSTTSIPYRRTSRARKYVARYLARAGIEIEGTQPFDIRVHDERFFARALHQGSLGFGEAYMDGWWDAPALDECICRILRAKVDEEASVVHPRVIVPALLAHVTNLQRMGRAFLIGKRHYDLGNDLFEAMLDRRMTYSCGYWKDADTLDAAQEAKLDLVCRKLGVEPGMTVLDIGCGWGGFAQFAAERYGAHVTGVTVSKEQAALAAERCAGLPVEVRLEDYRRVDGEFDRVVSIGMFEHVGSRNYRTFFGVVKRVLREDGVFLLHTIGRHKSPRSHGTDPWIARYIFPNSEIPCMAQISEPSERGFVLEDWQNIGPHYAPTLRAWYENFSGAWPKLAARYSERFYRMWKYYLLSCAGLFESRRAQVWQCVFTPRGTPGGMVSVR